MNPKSSKIGDNPIEHDNSENNDNFPLLNFSSITNSNSNFFCNSSYFHLLQNLNNSNNTKEESNSNSIMINPLESNNISNLISNNSQSNKNSNSEGSGNAIHENSQKFNPNISNNKSKYIYNYNF